MTRIHVLLSFIVGCLVIQNITTAARRPVYGPPGYIPYEVLETILEDEDSRRKDDKQLDRLKGFKNFIATVQVEMSGNTVRQSDLGKEMDSIADSIVRTYTERLNRAGIPIVDFSKWTQMDDKAILHLKLDLSPDGYNMYLNCKEKFVLARNKKIYHCFDIWQDYRMHGYGGILEDSEYSRRAMRETASDLLDAFFEAYQKTNPSSRKMGSKSSPTIEEQKNICEFLKSQALEPIFKDVTCMLPVMQLESPEKRNLISPIRNKDIALYDKLYKKYAGYLKRNNIPLTSITGWEKDPFKSYFKFTIITYDEYVMFGVGLFDRYVLPRNPKEFEYYGGWAYLKSIKDRKVSPKEINSFISSQSTAAMKEFIRVYKEDNCDVVERQK